MQSNGSVVHENGTSSEVTVNGLGSVVKSNGRDDDSVYEGHVVVGGEADHRGRLFPRRKKQTKLSGKDADIIRLIGQHLREMGFSNTLSSLVEESGCPLEHPKAASFRSHVISGEWDEASSSLDNLVPLLEDSSNIEKMRLLLLQEKYLELLESGREIEALYCLRHELAPIPIHHSDKQLQVLTSYMMYSDKAMLRKAANWPGRRGGAREQLMDKLQGFLPPSVMLPPRRLQQLLTQAVQMQVERCPFHYLEQDALDYSLLNDHICTRSQFPSENVHVLTDHSEEVWYVKFSHNGCMLASGSKDGQVIIWDMKGSRPTKRHVLKAQGDGIAVLDWSPDDSLLLCCGRDDNPEAIVFSTETGEVKCSVSHSADDNLTCCAWHNNGTKFYVGGTRGQFLECMMDGSVTASWEGIRVQAIATHPSSDNVYAADTHNRIRQYNFREKSSSTLVQENHSIMSFTLSKSGHHALLNVSTQGVHLWDLEDRCLLHRYQGITQSLYAIYSCYGGVRESFLASGSEDHHVYIWHHQKEHPVIILKGHSRTVNCVDWNSVNPTMLASGSDDGTVRVWGTEAQMKAELQYQKERERLGEKLQDTMQEVREEEEEDSHLRTPTLTGNHHYLRSSDPSGLGNSGGERGESMDIQQISRSSELEPDLERIESSASSLSLSSERLDEGLLGIISLSRTRPRTVSLRPVILDGMEPRQERSESVSSWPLSALDETTSRIHLSSLEFGSTPRGGESGGAGSRTRLQLSLTHDSSLDQESSQLSQDSSNGSASQIDQLNEEEPLLSLASDSSMRYRTGSGSPSASTPVDPTTTTTSLTTAATTTPTTSLATPLAVAGRVSGESVIVGGRVDGGGESQRISGNQGRDTTEQTSEEIAGAGESSSLTPV